MTNNPDTSISKQDIHSAVKTLMIGSSGPEVINTVSQYLIIDKGLYRAARSVKSAVKMLVASTLHEMNSAHAA